MENSRGCRCLVSDFYSSLEPLPWQGGPGQLSMGPKMPGHPLLTVKSLQKGALPTPRSPGKPQLHCSPVFNHKGHCPPGRRIRWMGYIKARSSSQAGDHWTPVARARQTLLVGGIPYGEGKARLSQLAPPPFIPPPQAGRDGDQVVLSTLLHEP